MKTLVTLLVVVIAFSCNNNSKNTTSIKSFELPINHPQDTINIVDGNGKKQGIWWPSPTNKLKDTTLFKNDSIMKQW